MGAVWLSKENLKKITDELAKMGKMSKEEGERLFDEMEKTGGEYKEKLNSQVTSLVNKALDSAGLAKQSEVDELRNRIAELEARLSADKQEG